VIALGSEFRAVCLQCGIATDFNICIKKTPIALCTMTQTSFYTQLFKAFAASRDC